MLISKIKNWPFKSKVILHWVNSPYISSTNRQWRTMATFRFTDQLKMLEVPWGILPWLKLGQIFQDGKPLSETIGEQITIDITPESFVLKKAVDVLPKEFYLLQSNDNLTENCIVFQDKNMTIILPVIEAIRAILAINKSLAYGLLESSYLRRIITRYEIRNQVLSISFSQEIPYKSLTEATIRLIARILYDDSFQQAWHSVYSQRFAIFNITKSEKIPLSIKLPHLHSSWRVKAICNQSICLILEILEISPKNNLPFKEIQYDHPSYKEIDTTGRISEVDNGHIIPLPASQDIDISEQSPNQSKTLKIIDTVTSPMLESNTIIVTKIKKITQINNDIVIYKKTPIHTGLSETVTLSDKAPNGKFPAAEFKTIQHLQERVPVGLKGLSNIDGFGKFSQAIQHIQNLYAEWQINVEVYPLNINIPFARVDNGKRKYCIVKVSSEVSKKVSYILEFARPDARSISTLIFTISQGTNLKKIISDLINNTLSPNGSWKIDDINQLKELDYLLAKHCEDTPKEWSARLSKKVVHLWGKH